MADHDGWGDAVNLREQLGVRKTVDFEIDLPRGWARFDIDGGHDELLGGMKKRFMEAHRPDLFVEAKAMFDKAFDGMRKNDVFAFFAPAGEQPDGAVVLPASINASIRTGEPGQSLDKMAHNAIQKYGAKPLFGDPRTLRFERERTIDLEGEAIINHSLIYFTPIPGTQRRRALQLVAAFARTPDVAPDAPALVATRALLDACVATLRWNRGSA